MKVPEFIRKATIIEKVVLLLVISMVLLIFYSGFREVEQPEAPYTTITKSIISAMGDKSELAMPLSSLCINNPTYPSSLTLLVNDKGVGRVLQVDIVNDISRNSSEYPSYTSSRDALYYVERDNMMRYDKNPHVVIHKDKPRYISTKQLANAYRVEIFYNDAHFSNNR